MIRNKLITDVSSELVSTSEVKTHLRIDISDEDTYLGTLITVAREWAEMFTGRTIGEKTLEGIMDDFPSCDFFELPDSPIKSITSIKYTNSDGDETTWNSSYYVSNLDLMPERVYLAYGETWPSFTPYPTGAVRIRYVAGHTATNLPEAIKQSILLLVGELYENREASTEFKTYALPFSVKTLLYPYRVRWFK